MRLAIHNSKNSFSDNWISYCTSNGIKFKLVNCYSTDIIQQLDDCDALMWHFSQNCPKAILFAKQLIYSVETSGKNVFPDFNTVWHFDDKLGQKYLLEAIGAPLVKTSVFFDEVEALEWVKCAIFPIVFKLRGGAGSQNVRLVKNCKHAIRLVKRAFGRGFLAYYALGSLKERWRKYRIGNSDFKDLLEGLARFIVPPPYAMTRGRERGYIYFQEFIPNNDHDIRIIVIGDKAFAVQRLVRVNDFRASGSGYILYDRRLFNESTIRLSFSLASKLKCQCIAFDFVHWGSKPLLVEISYGFIPAAYISCPGYWDKQLTWNEGAFNPYGWMIEDLITRIKEQNI